MQTYCFFKKRNHINALEKSDNIGAEFLREWGYLQLPEELVAADAEKALKRLSLLQERAFFSEGQLSGRSILRWQAVVRHVPLLRSVLEKLVQRAD